METSKKVKSKKRKSNIITVKILAKCLKQLKYSINKKHIKIIVDITNKNFNNKEMASQFLAQLTHESGGFNYTKEIAFINKKCTYQYESDKGAPGKTYYGRGFIQLSWPKNYKEASQDLYGNDSLYEDPDKVELDPYIGAEVSVWYWKKYVEGQPGVGPDHFGYSTKAINGKLECNNKNIEQSKNRYKIYVVFAKALKLKKIADEKGCYKI